MGWYNWHFTKIYPNQAYWKQQHTNYLNSWVSGMGPDGVLQPKPPAKKKGIAAWSLSPPAKVQSYISGALQIIGAVAAAVAFVYVTAAVAASFLSASATVTYSSMIINGAAQTYSRYTFEKHYQYATIHLGMSSREASDYAQVQSRQAYATAGRIAILTAFLGYHNLNPFPSHTMPVYDLNDFIASH